jgi:hypothetical protein
MIVVQELLEREEEERRRRTNFIIEELQKTSKRHSVGCSTENSHSCFYKNNTDGLNSTRSSAADNVPYDTHRYRFFSS